MALDNASNYLSLYQTKCNRDGKFYVIALAGSLIRPVYDRGRTSTATKPNFERAKSILLSIPHPLLAKKDDVHVGIWLAPTVFRLCEHPRIL